MDYFKKLNEKLDLGWKYTDCACPTCKKQALFDPSTDSFQCILCNKTLDLERTYEEKTEIKEEIPLEPKEKPNFIKNKAKDPSKQLAQKLLEGWTMLEECCPDCLVPLMRPRKGGSAICVSCDYKWEKGKKELDSIKSVQKEPENIPLKNDKNHDKPRPLTVKETQGKKNIIEAQEEAIGNLSMMILGLTRLYKGKIEIIEGQKGFEAAEEVIKGPLKGLLGLQGELLQNYAKLKEL